MFFFFHLSSLLQGSCYGTLAVWFSSKFCMEQISYIKTQLSAMNNGADMKVILCFIKQKKELSSILANLLFMHQTMLRKFYKRNVKRPCLSACKGCRHCLSHYQGEKDLENLWKALDTDYLRWTLETSRLSFSFTLVI